MQGQDLEREQRRHDALLGTDQDLRREVSRITDLDGTVKEARAVMNHALAIPEASQAQDGGEP